VRANDGLPKVRQDGLVVRELPDEVLVYDLESHRAHCLNSTAAAVWRHCDGETSPAEIAFRLAREVGEPVDEDVVWLALEDLGRLELLEAPVVRATSGMSRRDVMRKGALVASALAVPTVFSLFAPTASASVCQEPCSPSVPCVGTCTTCHVSGICVLQ
jgi:hypothetical protein